MCWKHCSISERLQRAIEEIDADPLEAPPVDLQQP
jgi:hypothetical protein